MEIQQNKVKYANYKYNFYTVFSVLRIRVISGGQKIERYYFRQKKGCHLEFGQNIETTKHVVGTL